MSVGSNKWIRYFSPPIAPSWKLICFPFAGGGSNVYRRWVNHLPNFIKLGAVLLPGRETRMGEPCVASADAVCEAVINELVGSDPNLPLALFGHSMGAVLALEVAFRLRQRFDREPSVVFVSGRRPPHMQFGGEYHLAPDDVFIRELKRLNGTPDSIFEDEEMRRIVLRTLRHDYSIVETYQMDDNLRLSCPVITCASDQDTEAAPEEMQLWAELTNGRCAQKIFPGGHFYINEQTLELTRYISGYLSRLVKPTSYAVPLAE